MKITQTRLKELLHYNPDTGVFTWVSRPLKSVITIGEEAGCIKENGYRVITLDKRRYYAHVLARFYMAGTWPSAMTDHEDRDKSNNAYSNLRDASAAQNTHNSTKRSTNTSGYTGVSFCKARKKFRVTIQIAGKKFSLGDYTDVHKAGEVYALKAKELHGDFYAN